MRKLQNPPNAGPEHVSAPKVWKVALLLGTAFAMRPGTAGGKSQCENFQYGSLNSSLACAYQLNQESLARENIARDEREAQVRAEQAELREQLPPILEDIRQSIDEIRTNISSTRPALQRELSDGTETRKKLAAIKIELLELATSLISRVEAKVNSGMFSLIFSITSRDMFVDDTHVGSPYIPIGSLGSIDTSQIFFELNFGSLDSISQFAVVLREDTTNAFKLVEDLGLLITPEELAGVTGMTDSFRALEAEYRTEISGFASDYIFLGPLLVLTNEKREKVIDSMLTIPWPDAFLDLPLQDQANVIKSILSGVDIAVVDVTLTSAAVTLSRVGWERGSNVDIMRPIDMPSDAVSIMDAAASFLTAEEATAFKIFLEPEEPTISPPAQISSDDCSNPFMLATNYILQGPLAQLDGNAKEQVITYLMGNISRIMDGPASSFSGLPLIRQAGVIMTTMRELGLDAGMDTTLASVAAVLSHVGTNRGASPEVMQQINSPQSASTMMGAADSFLTPEEAAEFRGLFGIARTESVSTLSP